MLRRFASSRRTAAPLALAAMLATALAAAASAQSSSGPIQGPDDQKLEKLLDGADLFYKKNYNESGQRWEYKVAWSENGETTMFVLALRSVGTKGDGSKINVVYCWAEVMSADKNHKLSPEIIKGVATLNDGMTTGNISANDNGVFVNTGMVLKDLSSDAMWLYLWDLHASRLWVKGELQKAAGG